MSSIIGSNYEFLSATADLGGIPHKMRKFARNDFSILLEPLGGLQQ